VGTLGVVVGRPGREPVASLALVHATGDAWRTWRGGSIDRLIRLDVAIHDGFSGASFVSAQGELLGITTSGLARGSGVVVPVSTIDRVVDHLLEHGTVASGYLGIAVHGARLSGAAARDVQQRSGALVVGVEPDSPAERSGIVLGDVLLAIDGRAVEHAGDLMALLGTVRPGTRMVARVFRGGELREISVTVGSRPTSPREQ
jgi:S1-C subfamily serine protease